MGAKRSVRPAPDYNWNYSKASAPPTGGTLTFLFSNNLCIFFILSELCRFSCDVWYKVTKMRANHNNRSTREITERAVMYGTKLKNESKSQLIFRYSVDELR